MFTRPVSLPALLLLAALLVCPAAVVAQGHEPAATPAAAQPTASGAQPVEHSKADAAHGSDHAVRDTLAKLLNFAVLIGVLVYFLRTPLAGYLSSRSAQIRQDLVAAAELRRTASAELEAIQQQLNALPAELAALKARGEEDVRAEQVRIAEAATIERQRLLDQTRREIEMRLRLARRELTEYAAELAVSVAQERIKKIITLEDQLRLVDRYTTQLKEAR
jgi:F-type H+-transporting ATPase subunit b